MTERDRERLKHMLDAATRARRLVSDRTRSDLDLDDVLGLALTRLLEILGEAARAVTPATREEYGDIPWNEIAGTRDRLIHGYFNVDMDIVWAIVHDDLPSLIGAIQQALSGKASR